MPNISYNKWQKIKEAFLKSSKWQSMRQQIISRDGGVCSICGFDTSLNVHHIKSHYYFPDLALDPDNLITLCQKHHKEIHNNKTTKSALVKYYKKQYEERPIKK